MILNRTILQDMMKPTTQEVDIIRDILNSHASNAAGIGLSETECSMSNLQALVADNDEALFPMGKLPAATVLVLKEYMANSINVYILTPEGEKETFDPSDSLRNPRLVIRISWGSEVQT